MAGKKKATDGRLSIRQYAATVPCSHVAVKKAIDAGKISSSAWDGEYIYDKAEADREWGDIFRIKEGVTAPAPPPVQVPEMPVAVRQETVKKANEDGILKWDGGPVPTGLNYKEALRVSEILKAENSRIKNDELIGLLVRKSDIEKQLFVAGLEMRKMFERFPQIVVDNVIGAKNRTEALRALDDGIVELLDKMTAAITAALS